MGLNNHGVVTWTLRVARPSIGLPPIRDLTINGPFPIVYVVYIRMFFINTDIKLPKS